MASSIPGAGGRVAAFFDLDKTIISKSSTLAYGPSVYRNGLISRSDAVRGAVAQLVFTRRGAGPRRMERIREQVSGVCRGWPADRVTEIVARHLEELILAYVMLEAVGHPHAVNPDRALRRLAAERGWPVLAFTAWLRRQPRARAAPGARFP